MGRRARKRRERWAALEAQERLAAQRAYAVMEQMEAQRRQREAEGYVCPACADDFLERVPRPFPTSYPLSEVRYCPRCGAEYCVLWDGALCTERELDGGLLEKYRRWLHTGEKEGEPT